MQEALNRIAPTKRTPAGMPMTRSESAFRFEFDKSDLRTENRETLSRIAGVLLASDGYRIFVDGHTDDVGTDEYNKSLSERRAATVRKYLVEAGIPSEVIATQGFGKQQPVANEKSRDARAQNRRVEIGIVDTIIHYEQKIRK
jgi:OOP family OmpA-OmpF porin